MLRPHRDVVLVTGAPGAGKTTLAVPLAAELGFALLAKDRIKETLAETLGWAPGRANDCRADDCRADDCWANDCWANDCRADDCRADDGQADDCRDWRAGN